MGWNTNVWPVTLPLNGPCKMIRSHYVAIMWSGHHNQTLTINIKTSLAPYFDFTIFNSLIFQKLHGYVATYYINKTCLCNRQLHYLAV